MVSVISSSSVKRKESLNHSIGCESSSSPVEKQPSSTRLAKLILPDVVDVPLHKEKCGVPRTEHADEHSTNKPSRKRHRPSSEEVTGYATNGSAHSLGRPLWVQSKKHRKVSLDTTTVLSATLLYNLAQCFHLMAITDQTASPTCFSRALTLYKLSAKTMLRAPLHDHEVCRLSCCTSQSVTSPLRCTGTQGSVSVSRQTCHSAPTHVCRFFPLW